MHLTPLSMDQIEDWSALLAVVFDRPQPEMVALLRWLDRSHSMVSWGVWEGDVLIAQYTSLLREMSVSLMCAPVGVCVNMAVHPVYRGRGLIKQVAEPVYNTVRERGAWMGVGFSNAQGVRVDRNSRGYGYQVLGQMRSVFGMLPIQHGAVPNFRLTNDFPQVDICPPETVTPIHFGQNTTTLRQRFAEHPFRAYRYGVWQEGDVVCGVVIYRPVRIAGVPGVALLDAYGADRNALLRRWCKAVRGTGVRFVHLLASANAALLNALSQVCSCIPAPFTRTPYYLTAKPLMNDLPEHLLEFKKWDVVGGDVL